MTTESTTITTPSTLLEELVERTGLSWLQVTAAVELVMLLELVGVAYLGGILARPFNADYWRVGLLMPVIVAYLLLAQPTLRRLREGAIKAFRPLVPLDDADFYQSLSEAPLFNRRRGWRAVGISAVGWLLLSRPWDYSGPAWTWSSVGQSVWLTLSGLLDMMLLYGLMGFLIYSALAGTRLFTDERYQPLDVNIFDLESLEPIARWSLGIALSFIGGMTLGLLFLPWHTLSIENFILYVPLTLTPALVFFLNMTSVRNAIAEAKERELKMVRDNLAAASKALRDLTVKGQVADLGPLPDFVDTWLAYEGRVKEVSEWPGAANIRQNLVLSSLLPPAIGIAKGLLPQLLQRLPPEVLQQLQRFLPLP